LPAVAGFDENRPIRAETARLAREWFLLRLIRSRLYLGTHAYRSNTRFNGRKANGYRAAWERLRKAGASRKVLNHFRWSAAESGDR